MNENAITNKLLIINIILNYGELWYWIMIIQSNIIVARHFFFLSGCEQAGTKHTVNILARVNVLDKTMAFRLWNNLQMSDKCS